MVGKDGFIEDIRDDDLQILPRQRLLVELVVSGGAISAGWLALNEVNIHRGASGQMIWLDCFLDETRLTSSYTDGYQLVSYMDISHADLK